MQQKYFLHFKEQVSSILLSKQTSQVNPDLSHLDTSLQTPHMRINRSFQIQNSPRQKLPLLNFSVMLEEKNMKNSLQLSPIRQSPRKRGFTRRQTLYMIEPSELKKFERWHKRMKHLVNNPLKEIIFDNFIPIMSAIHLQHSKHLIDIYSEVCEQLSQCSILIARITLFLSQYLFEVQDYSKASYFIKQAFYICDLGHLNKERCKILMHAAKIARHYKLYQDAERFLLDALEYSWLEKSRNLEMEVYEALGLVLYYQQRPLHSYEMHKRFTDGLSENSILRENIIRQLPINTPQLTLNQAILNRVNLPFQEKVKRSKIKSYEVLDGQECMKNLSMEMNVLLKTDNLIVLQHRNPNQLLYYGRAPACPIPQTILEIKRNHLRQKKNYKFQLTERQESVSSYEAVLERVKAKVTHNQMFEEKTHKIYLSQKEEKNSKLVMKMKDHFQDILN